MVAVIVLIDQLVWRPVIAWAEKFKMEQVESTNAPTSWVLDFPSVHAVSRCFASEQFGQCANR